MSDLVAFLTARLDEDEAAANGAWPGRWDAEIRPGLVGDIVDVLVPFYPRRHDETEPNYARTGLTPMRLTSVTEGKTNLFFVHFQPQRILADVASRRAIIAEHGRGPGVDICDRVLYGEWPCPTLRHLAAPFADHPDFDAAWSVTP